VKSCTSWDSTIRRISLASLRSAPVSRRAPSGSGTSALWIRDAQGRSAACGALRVALHLALDLVEDDISLELRQDRLAVLEH